MPLYPAPVTVAPNAALNAAYAPITHADTHRTTGADDMLFPFGFTRQRVETFPRFWGQQTTPTSGSVTIAYFVPPWTLTIGKLAIVSQGTNAVSMTVARLGLYTIAGNGDATLVARTASDPATILNAQNTYYQPALDTTGGYPASYQLVRGTAYAFAFIVVASTVPTVRGALAPTSTFFGTTVLPRLASQFTGQTDLPTSITNAQQTNFAAAVWMAGIP